MMATQSYPTRRASRVARSKRGPRVNTTVEYKMAVIIVILFVVVYLCVQYLFLMLLCVCFAKGIMIPFAYNSSESGSCHNHTVI